jgi:probable HAF family extracellular repeat protein
MKRGARRAMYARALAAAVMAFAHAAAAQNRAWTLLDLGTLGGAGSYGTAINGNGLVVGCADTKGGEVHAFVYSSGSMRDLGPGCAMAINSDGTIAGRNASGDLVVWSGPAVTPLGLKGDVGGIDSRGVVVGTYRQGAGTFAFKYENGTVTTLASNAAATGINSRGQIVGAANNRAFLYEGGALHDLGTLGGNGSSAKGINDKGEVVGMSTDSNGQPRPFIYDGRMRPLPTPSYAGAVAINNYGQVVGMGEGTFGFLVEADSVTRLDTLPDVVAKGWRRLDPKGISDRGWIVGTGTAPSGDLRAFLLIPGEGRTPVAAYARIGRRLL